MRDDIPINALILASSSSRRKDILREYGVRFVPVSHRILNEPSFDGKISPEHFVEKLSMQKARSIEADYPDNFILGSDTIIFLDRAILGKPESMGEALSMLGALSGKVHEVYTGIGLVNKRLNVYESNYDRTLVRIKTLTQDDIIKYVKTNDPLAKAGAYGIQDINGVVEYYDGSFTNVVGLCIEKLLPLFKKYGLS